MFKNCLSTIILLILIIIVKDPNQILMYFCLLASKFQTISWISTIWNSCSGLLQGQEMHSPFPKSTRHDLLPIRRIEHANRNSLPFTNTKYNYKQKFNHNIKI